MTIAIVTDSTSDLTPELLAQIGVKSVPLYVLFDGKMHKDGLEIRPQDIFTGLKAGKKTPSTSQPSPAEFAAVYTEALQVADEVLSLHISGQMSGTVGSARLAAQEFGEGHGRGQPLGQHGPGPARPARRRTGPPGPEHGRDRAAAGGRGKQGRYPLHGGHPGLPADQRAHRGAQALLGSLLNIKPILVVKDGRVDSGGRVRGHKKAMADLVEHVRKYTAAHGSTRVAVMCTPGGEEYVKEVRAGLAGLAFEDMGDHMIGAVVATHAGPGTVGVTLEPVTV